MLPLTFFSRCLLFKFVVPLSAVAAAPLNSLGHHGAGAAGSGYTLSFGENAGPTSVRVEPDEAHCSRTRTVGTNARASLQARPPAPRCSAVPKCDRLSLARLRAMRPRSGERVSATGRCARCAGILTRLIGSGSATIARLKRALTNAYP